MEHEKINYAWSFQLDQVENWVYWNDFFTKDECKKIIDHSKNISLDNGKFGLNKLNDSGKCEAIEFSAVRNCKIAFLNPIGIEWAYSKLTDAITILNNKFFNFDLWGFQEGLQFTEYNSPNGHYTYHIDKIYNGPIRKLSVVVQLTDESEYEGGDLEILIDGDPSPIKMKKSIGHLVVFPSYILHRVVPVTKGTRHSLVGWVTGKPFR